MMLEILNISRLMISLIRTADFVEKIQSRTLRLCEEAGSSERSSHSTIQLIAFCA